ncbi:ClpX C4-type zinc finger protein [Saccharopolyspora sp. K220]|uniref:ClpX C4-type zinc finger protein n=1 Tax=Saccharopolyspora soli TaxID=2926618 RepID=UPI001F570448|nr:ClpX C4-type zinc finger protein [Saccharopolyspora soli]MCI2418437.1 ClpX C4-type zinc finger protein [Saccharopolyspora soli]
MVIDERLLRRARDAGARWAASRELAELAKSDYHQAVRRLHLTGASMREIAEALEISHQRVHQIVEASGGTAGWKPRQESSADMACTFCEAPKSAVGKLIAGPGVFICDSCVALARQAVHGADEVAAPRTPLAPQSQASALTCSFCDKPGSQVRRLVAGPDARICDGCVQFCDEVLAAQPG